MSRLVFSALSSLSAGAVVSGLVVAAWFPMAPEVAPAARVPDTAITTSPPVVAEQGVFMNGFLNSYAVGSSVRPGLWSNEGSENCRWSRNAGSSWETAGAPEDPIVVSLRPGAKFETRQCPPWAWVGESK